MPQRSTGFRHFIAATMLRLVHDIPLITTIAVAFTAAWVLGLITQRLGLSPIVGYLLAGVLIGPHTPGYVGDMDLAQQLAEVGVILLMFGVGLHFHLSDLLAVRGVAIPGAIVQSAAATLLSVVVFAAFGFPLKAGLVIGLAISVASTVVLMRVLMDADALESPEGHVAVGWLLVEDVFTVIVLVLIPVLGAGSVAGAAGEAGWQFLPAVGLALLKLAALVAIVMLAGSRAIPWVMVQVARFRSRELFTLTVLVVAVAVATGAYVFFGASMALGAFLAGMVVAQSPVSQQAASDALPLRDAFAVLFFVAAGMLFDPAFVLREPLMILAVLGLILIAKPLAALAIVALLGHSARTALTVAIGLAQIGEFSFILAELARRHGLMPDAGQHALVAGAILSIALNPLLFRSLPSVERWLRSRPHLWRLLNGRAERRALSANAGALGGVAAHAGRAPLALVVGYGPVGRAVDRLLREAGLATIIIDLNMDTIAELHADGRAAIFGDGSHAAILEQAGVRRARYLVLTLPHAAERGAIVLAARNLNPSLRVLVRARYLNEREDLQRAGATAAVFEEGEAAVALARLVLADTGVSREIVDRKLSDLRLRLIQENVSTLGRQSVRSVMVPWSRVHRLSRSADAAEVREQVSRHRYSRWPVVDPQTGRPIGYLLVKDLVADGAAAANWAALVRPLRSVRPEDDIESTLLDLQRERGTIAVVQDAGRPVGLITIEDILEQVVGRIEDEYPRTPSILLRDALRAGGAALELFGRTPELVIAELAAAIQPDSAPPDVDIAALALARERDVPTDIGLGVAIPHARCPGLAQPLLVLGRSAEGVMFSANSTEPVRLVFLLVTPSEQPDLQVYLLGRLAAVVSSALLRQRLREARSAAEAIEIVADADEAAAGEPAGV